jgi:hypothetical protein
MTTFGDFSIALSWSTTAASVPAAATRRIPAASTSPFSAAWQT